MTLLKVFCLACIHLINNLVNLWEIVNRYKLALRLKVTKSTLTNPSYAMKFLGENESLMYHSLATLFLFKIIFYFTIYRCDIS